LPAAAPQACDAAKLAGEGRAAGGPGCEGAMLLAAPSPARPSESWLARACLRVDSEWGVGQRGLAAERTLSQCRCRRGNRAERVRCIFGCLTQSQPTFSSVGCLERRAYNSSGSCTGNRAASERRCGQRIFKSAYSGTTRCGRTLRANSAVSDSTFRESAECGTGQTHARADHAGVPSRIGSAALREAAPCAAMP
jgi:hypothetical protein